MQFHALALHRFHAREGFNQVTLDPGIGFRLVPQLPADHRSSNNREANKEGHHRKGPEGELHRIEQHHSDIDDRKNSI